MNCLILEFYFFELSGIVLIVIISCNSKDIILSGIDGVESTYVSIYSGIFYLINLYSLYN